ncbi:ligase-associated DNA damage response exonuclease [Luteimonas mephitis]|uniref:ligase-associated DNA damage response exonuclease n=1 Tax=Luteimonas mephitis TaxID=83615 RepID=UPI003A8F159C
MPSRADDLVIASPEGLYCPAGGFHIDPSRPVPVAVITHGHGDHARSGMGTYHVAREGLPILQWRLGKQDYRVHPAGERFRIGGVQVSLHPAGHVLGSTQVRIEAGGETWVVSGDYKRDPDPTCLPFEVVHCDVFVTESTFALPIYRWAPASDVARDIEAWRVECEAQGEAAILYCYALGKAQRVLAELAPISPRPALLHGAIDAGVAVYRDAGVEMLPTQRVSELARDADVAGSLVLAPPSAAGSPWIRRFRRAQQGFASGWMRIRGNRRRRNLDRGFVVSDHADWPSLLRTVEQTGARRVVAMHGDSAALVRVLCSRGLDAATLDAGYGEDD